jgi:hypothetical protein
MRRARGDSSGDLEVNAREFVVPSLGSSKRIRWSHIAVDAVERRKKGASAPSDRAALAIFGQCYVDPNGDPFADATALIRRD